MMLDEKITLSEALEMMCDEFCKYPEYCRTNIKDVDEADAYMRIVYCARCPLSRTIENVIEPEPVAPVVNDNLVKGGWIGRETECCGVCGNNLRLAARYCDRCGRKVKRPELDDRVMRRIKK